MDLSQTLTIYGRKPVLEALSDASLTPRKLHLAQSNKPGEIVRQIQSAAKIRGVDIQTHDRGSLSRISRNGKQDQGVALDLFCPQFNSLTSFLSTLETENTSDFRGVLLDGVTNPQNVGMTIRSCCAAGVNAIFYPKNNYFSLFQNHVFISKMSFRMSFNFQNVFLISNVLSFSKCEGFCERHFLY